MMSEKYDLSIILPVYNEAKTIEKVIVDFNDKVVKKFKGKSELVVAEDGSTDGTKEVLKKLNKKINFRLVSGKERKGYTRAVKDALMLAQGKYIFLSDTGGGHEPADFFKLFKYVDRYDIVSGYKKQRQDPLYRIILSRVYNLYVSLLFLHRFYDVDSGFKIYKKKVVQDVLPNVRVLKECVSTELLLRSYSRGYKIKEVPVLHYKRDTSEARTFTYKKLSKIVMNLIIDMLRLRMKI